MSEISTSLGKIQSGVVSTQPKRSKRFRPTFHKNRSYYGAAQQNSTTQDWSSQRFNAAEIIRRYQPILVGRARQQRQDNDYVKNYVRRLKVNVSGPKGIQVVCNAKQKNGKRRDRRLCEAHDRGWLEFQHKRNADIKRRRNFTRLEHCVLESLAIDGEFFVHVIQGRTEYGFALQLIDAQRCPIALDIESLKNGNYVRHGIEYDEFDVPVAYYFIDQYAARYGYSNGYTTNGRNYQRIPASEIIHGFIDDLPEGQGRGMPWVGTSLFRLRMISGYEDAALVNARASAGKQGFIVPPDHFREDEDESTEDLLDEIEFDPGSIDVLPSGSSFHTFDSKFPTGEHGAFLKGGLRGIASGFGDSYNGLSNDFEGVNYTSLRASAIDVRDNWKIVQGDIQDIWTYEIHSRWLRFALLSGKIRYANGNPVSITEYDRIQNNTTYRGRRWPWVDPHKEEAAATEAQQNFRKSPSQIIEESGGNAMEIWEDGAIDVDRISETYGIPREKVLEKLLNLNPSKEAGNATGNQPGDEEPTT